MFGEEIPEGPSSRLFAERKDFQLSIERALGPQIRASSEKAVELWAALTGEIEWVKGEGRPVWFTWRSAGEVVAWVREEGSYIDWYFASDAPGIIAKWIEEALAAEGWFWRKRSEPPR